MLQALINEVIELGFLPQPVSVWRELKGGTQSTVGVLGTEDRPHLYVLKANTKELIENETRFLSLYPDIGLLPTVLYVDPALRYFVYDFIPGSTRYVRGNKRKLMTALVDGILAHYVHPESYDAYKSVETTEHTEDSIRYAASFIDGQLSEEDHSLVAALSRERSDVTDRGDLYVLHGDFGVHNFLFTDDGLAGVIDPIPVIGCKRYDLLYAFCSSPDELTLPILLHAVQRAEEEREVDIRLLSRDMILELYRRISTCLRFHPEDFPQYLQAWGEWKKIYASS
ncbi:phosphotransferase [Cohnella nanjingensis]|uniref:Phosphotransferase n=1 Tax=Cohnella nanjingensis TaxID=1387779 RepID=A0A7X0VFA8_9BACL|nr:phosphotransferase [Cohnella nanjingensis]MBB6671860.1 phosphotransferase [Cohnella nanjingensis]